MKFLVQPGSSHRLGDYLKQNLSGNWTQFRAAVAFVKRSGTRYIVEELSEFSQTRHVEIVTGIDHQGTSAEGLQDLLESVKPNGRIIVFHNLLPSTFHPKIYLFKSSETAEVLIGSGNLTQGGLFTNYESTVRLTLDLSQPRQADILQSIECALDKWMDTQAGTAHILNLELLTHLTKLGLVPSESSFVYETRGDVLSEESKGQDSDSEQRQSPFVARPVPPAPKLRTTAVAGDLASSKTQIPQVRQTSDWISPESKVTHFVMILQKTDVGVGQITSGTSRRSPEIFIPLSARSAAPDFWAWPVRFTSDPNRPEKRDRRGVQMRLGTNIISVNMMTWPDKSDFRLRCEALRSAGNIGDILHLEKVDPSIGFEYFVEIIPQGTSHYPNYYAYCTKPVRNSKKRFGYY